MSEFDEVLERKKKGSLKIYLGYAAGVGKTYSMLQEAHRLRARGYDVVIGYVELHARPDTERLVAGLESVPPFARTIGNQPLQEMNLHAILRRRPQIALIDELAHTNIAICKNRKRYEDVIEILEQGINVISTLNVQHLESIAERVSGALVVPVSERIPDRILALADQIVNVDVTTEELRERLRFGKVYTQEKAETALTRFFTHENLSLLRKFALQEATRDQLRKIEEEQLLSENAAKEADEAVMVAMSSDPTNAELMIRKGARLASQLSSRLYLVYVQRRQEAPQNIDSELQRKLLGNLKLAKTLGAEVITLQAENIPEALTNFAHTHKVRHVVFGKTRRTPLKDRLFGSFLLDFIYDSVGIDVHVVSPTTSREEST